MDNKSKLIIYGGGSAFVLAFAGTVYMGIQHFSGNDSMAINKKHTKLQEKVIETQKQTNQKESRYTEKVETPYTVNILAIGTGSEEYPSEKSFSLKEDLLNDLETAHFNSGQKAIEKQLDAYTFSKGRNLEIAGLYEDIDTLVNYTEAKKAEKTKTLKGGFVTPEGLAIAPLFLTESDRRSFISDESSLTPLEVNAEWMIKKEYFIKNEKEAKKDDVYKEEAVARSIFNTRDGITQIHVIELENTSTPDVPVRAYIIEYANGELELYGYYVPDGVTHYYQTVAFYKGLDKTIDKNTEKDKEKQQKEIDNGNLTDDALEQLLGDED